MSPPKSTKSEKSEKSERSSNPSMKKGKTHSESSPHSSHSSRSSRSSHSPDSPHAEIDVPRMMKRLKMKIDKEKQFMELIEKASKVMTMNAIQNILYVKEAMGNINEKEGNPRMISPKDVKNTQDLMERMKFYGNIQYGGSRDSFPVPFGELSPEEMRDMKGTEGMQDGSGKQSGAGGPYPPAFYMPNNANNAKNSQMGGSRAESFPQSYFDPHVASREPYFSKSQVAPLETQTSPVTREMGFARPAFNSSFSIDNVVEKNDAFQSGSGMEKKNTKLPSNTEHVKKSNILDVIEQLNKKYKKHPVEIQSPKVLNVLKDTVNANLEKLFAYYKANVSKDIIEVEKMKAIIKNNPEFIHLSKVPKAE